MTAFIDKALHRLRNLAGQLRSSCLRRPYWRLQGMRVGPRTRLPVIRATWPHQVSIGADCTLEDGIYFKFDGIWSRGPHIVLGDHCFIGANCEFNISAHIEVGRDTLIGSGCKFIDHNHNLAFGEEIGALEGDCAAIAIGRGVWLGCNVIVLPDSTLGNGSVVGAGAVVTKSIPENEIWGGIPARKLGVRPAKG